MINSRGLIERGLDALGLTEDNLAVLFELPKWVQIIIGSSIGLVILFLTGKSQALSFYKTINFSVIFVWYQRRQENIRKRRELILNRVKYIQL